MRLFILFVLGALLGGCTGGNNNPPCDNAEECADFCAQNPTQCESGVDAMIKAYIPALGTEITVNGIAATDCDGSSCLIPVEDYDLYRVNSTCPSHMFLEKEVDVNDDGTFEVGWNQNGVTGEGGLAPCGDYQTDHDDGSVDPEGFVWEICTRQKDGKIVLEGSNSLGVEPTITGDSFFGEREGDGQVHGSIENDLSKIYITVLSVTGQEYVYSATRIGQ